MEFLFSACLSFPHANFSRLGSLTTPEDTCHVKKFNLSSFLSALQLPPNDRLHNSNLLLLLTCNQRTKLIGRRNLGRKSAVSFFRPSISISRNTTTEEHYKTQTERVNLSPFVRVQAPKHTKVHCSEPRGRDAILTTQICSTATVAIVTHNSVSVNLCQTSAIWEFKEASFPSQALTETPLLILFKFP